mgnify:CR=1 FL=1
MSRKSVQKEVMIMADATGKRCYTVGEIQDILRISRASVYELLKQQEFRWVMVSGKYRISKKSFDEWLDQKQ